MINSDVGISVVMAVYKNDNFLFFEESIKSLLLQTLLPKEIIIVIDGQVDNNIRDVLHKFHDNKLFRFINLTENNGLANALNVGINQAKYDLIARMDADDICFPERLEKQIDFMFKEDLDIVGGQIIEFGTNIKDVISERKVPLLHNDMIKFLKLRSPFSHPTIVFKKNVFTSLEGYSLTVFPEDYDFFVRAYLNGFKFGNLNESVLWFRLGNNYSEAIKRRWGIEYAKNEYKLYKHFLHIGFFKTSDFLKAVLLKIPVRLLPFFVYKYIYFNILRKQD